MTESEEDDLVLPDGRVIHASTLRIYKARANLDRDQARDWFEQGFGPYDAERAIESGFKVTDAAAFSAHREEEARRRHERAEEFGPWLGILDEPRDRERIAGLFPESDTPVDVDHRFTQSQFERFRAWRRSVSADELMELLGYVARAQVDVESLDEWISHGFQLDEIRREIEAPTTGDDVDEWLAEFGPQEPVLSLGAMAELLGINPVTLRMWRRRNDRDSDQPFPAPRRTSGRSPLFSLTDVTRWVNEREESAGSSRPGRPRQRQSDGSFNRAAMNAPGRLLTLALEAAQGSSSVDDVRRFATGVLLSIHLLSRHGLDHAESIDTPEALKEKVEGLRGEPKELTTVAKVLLDTDAIPAGDRAQLVSRLVGLIVTRQGVRSEILRRFINQVLDRPGADNRPPNPTSTDPAVAKLVASVAATTAKESVLDPACGEGGLLAAFARRRPRPPGLYGQEKDESRWQLAVARLACWSDSPEVGITRGDSMESLDGSYDVVVLDPPAEWRPRDCLAVIDRTKNTNGRAIVVAPQEVVARLVRDRLEHVELVIGLPWTARDTPRSRIVVLDINRARDTVLWIEASPKGSWGKPNRNLRHRSSNIDPTVFMADAARLVDEWRASGAVDPAQFERLRAATVERPKLAETIDADHTRTDILNTPGIYFSPGDSDMMPGTSSGSGGRSNIVKAQELVDELIKLIDDPTDPSVAANATEETHRALKRFRKKLEKSHDGDTSV